MGRRHLFTQTIALLTVLAGTLAVPTSTVLAKDVTLKQTHVNHKKELKGGTLKVGYPSNTNFKGIFIQELGTDSETNRLAELGQSGLFRKDKNGKYVKGGLADVSFDRGSKTALITIGPKTRWSDGKPVTARDMAFVYEIIANKDSTSEYYSDALETIMGMKEYHEGKADKISGLQIKDSKHLLIHYKKMTPAMEYVDSGYLYNDAQPYHYLKDVPMSKMAQSDKVRKHPLFFGPYTIKKVVQGEAIEWVPNKYYGGKKPKLDKVVEEVVPVAQIAEAMRSHKYDVILHESRATYAKTSKVDQYVTLGTMAYGLQYMGFRVGDKGANGTSVLDKKLVTNNRSLRLALAYAMNTQQIVKEYGAGLQKWANSMVSPAYGAYHDNKIKPYYQNLKKADQLLDRAGFKRGKDGYRTQPNGKELTLHLLDQASGRGNDEIRANYMQLWKKIGVRVELVNDRPLEFNTYEDLLHSNSHKFDIWFGNWSLGQEPSTAATAAYSPKSSFNHGHFVTKENTKLLKSLNSEKAFNPKYRIEQMHKWQEYMRKEAYVVPLSYSYDLTAVGKNVKGMTVDDSTQLTVWDNVCLTK
ncbi:ABC transporter substrate-binding protein [Ligilactobacillus animalis]|uniref:ABC transporter substrate-binding protein n=2 Tax=Ligilactobacillus animalis TaxID=1605 RepID=UPI000826EDD7|nr:ABC transporter substrate-binding protein [Ligilactobacillus animalis]MDO5883394.1 ABC transporter substrate-binding protein [Ligilactobacillus animalis]MDU1487185.1 ABC transporter substrate-binding protein [Ligilactobacillus animalis]MDU8986317.1 ABC transporter substrate-binding protein [Ligilactobacillus animalis]OCX47135.1 peptide-binding protein [Ligilactobacillus animalis]THE19756.1 peptide-binding protein [Ligilactobacillus animalis]